jgi:hypothetical protein
MGKKSSGSEPIGNNEDRIKLLYISPTCFHLYLLEMAMATSHLRSILKKLKPVKVVIFFHNSLFEYI